MYFIISTKSDLSNIILVYAVSYHRETDSIRYHLPIGTNSRTEVVILSSLKSKIDV